jgi:chromate transporter
MKEIVSDKSDSNPTLWQLFIVFLKMGTFAYGGVYSMLALLEKELVQRKKWMTHESFSEAFTIGQIIPGAPIVNTGIFIGYHFGKFPGALITVTAQTLPALIKILLLATLYLKYHDLPAVQATMKGIGAGVVALIFSVVIQMGNKIDGKKYPSCISLFRCSFVGNCCRRKSYFSSDCIRCCGNLVFKE